MRILLTGGTGLLGGYLGRELVRQGHQIVALARGGVKARPRLPFPCEIHAWDGASEVPPAAAVKGADVVIHLAGENVAEQKWTSERKQRLRDSRIKAGASLVQALENSGVRPKVFLSASAVGFYGDAGEALLTEASPPGEDFLAELCREWEAAIPDSAAERVVHMRVGIILAAGAGFLDRLVPLFQRVGASRLGDGRQWLSWIHVDDIVRAIVHVLNTHSLSGAVNLVAPKPLTNADMTEILAAQIGAFRAPPVPRLALWARYGELASALFASQRVEPTRLIQSGFRFQYPDFAAALVAIFPDWKSGELLLRQDQWIPAAPEKVWEFFSDEHNLERLTPSILGFHVLGRSTPKLQEGSEIRYRLKIRGVPVKWLTRIARWRPVSGFDDVQIAGPYRQWHHRHDFEKLGEGVWMRDEVRYRLPLGWLGRLVAGGFVADDVKKIFAYRAPVIDEIFYSR